MRAHRTKAISLAHMRSNHCAEAGSLDDEGLIKKTTFIITDCFIFFYYIIMIRRENIKYQYYKPKQK